MEPLIDPLIEEKSFAAMGMAQLLQLLRWIYRWELNILKKKILNSEISNAFSLQTNCIDMHFFFFFFLLVG